jgi:spoIIIJ-associated protein
MSIEAQADLAENFVRELVRCFGITASTSSSIRDDAVHVAVEGEGVGILIGPRGSTVDALQELTRTAVHRGTDEHPGRIHVDVGGYRARRAEALSQFARRLAEEVLETGEPQALEPMSAPDRKVVHDAITEIDGVVTSSEGEDPHRYVVIRPEPASRSTGGSSGGDMPEVAKAAAEHPSTPDGLPQFGEGDGLFDTPAETVVPTGADSDAEDGDS